jgi:hypothetical protein
VASGLEGPAARAIGQVAWKLYGKAKTSRANKRIRADARTLVPIRVAEGLLAELSEAETAGLDDYLASPDFEEIAHQFVLGHIIKDVPWEELAANIRDELRHGLRTSAQLRTELLLTATDVVFGALDTAFIENFNPVGFPVNPGTIAVTAHLTAAAAANSRLLSEVGNLADFHEFARQLRAQVVAVHGHMRLPHLGVSRSVPYDQLYVEPVLRPELERYEVPDPTALAVSGRRSVILGDPGAGKSTLAAKLAHDIASDLVPGAEGRVPFLLVLRNFAGSFRKGGNGLAHYLEQPCRDPYNLEPPHRAVDYLLHNGRAVVLLDGLDELVEPELRRNFVQLVDGFVSRYPLVPVLVTARRIGYSDAPLDRRLFDVGIIAELDEGQVSRYAEQWFALDESTPEGERARMANSFLAESEGITDLRANPLLLALLCTMYSSEHYIPQNLAQIYERCAVMLFDRWDSMRGITLPGQFRGRLRGAVQYLAWELFNAEESGKALPRHRMVRVLADHLVAKRFDEDEAIATAEQFIEFCTGRAWILTDVGATDSEPRYGFTHRTFMEYFAAEHLVRTHPMAHQLWEALRPRILSGEWEVVAQIALQLLDRNVDGGVDEFLRLVLAETAGDLHERARLQGFAALSLGYLQPGQDVIAEVVTVALQSALEGEVRGRFCYWRSSDFLETTRIRDSALYGVMYGSSRGNLPVVRRSLTTFLSGQVELGCETALLLTLSLGRRGMVEDDERMSVWEEVQRDLLDRHSSALSAWSEHAPWADINAGTEPDQLAARFGPWSLYLNDAMVIGSLPSVAERLLDSDSSHELAGLSEALIAASRPWISDKRWWSDALLSTDSSWLYEHLIVNARWGQAPLAPMVLLCLPYLEARAFRRLTIQLPESVPLLHQLTVARTQADTRSDRLRSLRNPGINKEVWDFLISWVRREFDVLVPPPADFSARGWGSLDHGRGRRGRASLRRGGGGRRL